MEHDSKNYKFIKIPAAFDFYKYIRTHPYLNITLFITWYLLVIQKSTRILNFTHFIKLLCRLPVLHTAYYVR